MSTTGTHMTKPDRMVKVDHRRRISLAKVVPGIEPEASFFVRQDSAGNIVLTPAVSMTKAELDVLLNPDRAVDIDARQSKGKARLTMSEQKARDIRRRA